MSPQILNWIRLALPYMRWLAGQTRTTADDDLVSLLESIVGAPTAQAAAMVAAAKATAGHVASFTPAAPAAPAEAPEEPKAKGKHKGE